MSTGSSDVDEIRREMAKVRRDLHADVQGVVSTAEAATDWKRYITAYPWLILGAAATAGFLIVPQRQRTRAVPIGDSSEADLTKIREIVAETRQAVTDVTHSSGTPITPKKGMIGAAVGLAAPIAFRAAQGYALKFLENWIMQQQMSHPVTGPLFVQNTPEPDTSRNPRRGGVSP